MDFKPFQHFPTHSGKTSFWLVHSKHWISQPICDSDFFVGIFLISFIFFKGFNSTGYYMLALSDLLSWTLALTEIRSALTCGLIQYFCAVVKVWCHKVSNKNPIKQRASLVFAHALAAPSQTINSRKCIIKRTFSSLHLIHSSNPYSFILNATMHLVCLSCNSVLMYGAAIRACSFGVVLIPFSKRPNGTAHQGKLTF